MKGYKYLYLYTSNCKKKSIKTNILNKIFIFTLYYEKETMISLWEGR